jgi:hypothetical protein
MNANFTQITNLNVSALAVSPDALRDRFVNIEAGNFFLRHTKKGDGEVFMKIGKRNAVHLVGAKGAVNKILKFKETAKVFPLNADLKLNLSEPTEAGRVLLANRAQAKNGLESLSVLRRPSKAEKAPKPLVAILERIANGMGAPVLRQQPSAFDQFTGS